MKSNLFVLLVCQAGKGLGLGHLSRTLAVAIAFQEHAHAKLKVLIQGHSTKKADLASLPHQIIPLEHSLNDSILRIVSLEKPSIVIFDIHPKWIPHDLPKLLNELRSLGIKTVGIDSIGFDEMCDMGYIPSFWVDPTKMKTCRNRVFYGWDCYLLPKPKKITTWKAGHKVLVLTGGSDITQLAKTFPQELDRRAPQTVEIHWMKGPYAEFPILPSNPRLSWVIHDAPENLDNIINGTNYAITIFGVTFFELLRYGIPTVVFSPYAEKDQAELAMIKKEEISMVVENSSQTIDAFMMLMQDTEQASWLSERAKNKIHPNGTKLFVERVHLLLNIQ